MCRGQQYTGDRSAGQYAGDRTANQYSGDQNGDQYLGGRATEQNSGDRTPGQGSQEQALGSTPAGGGPLSSGSVDRTLPGQHYPEHSQGPSGTGTTEAAGATGATHDQQGPAAGGLASWIPFTQVRAWLTSGRSGARCTPGLSRVCSEDGECSVQWL